jgi:hypothetical protein
MAAPGGSVTPRPGKTLHRVNDALCNGASMHEVGEFAGRSDIHITEVYFVRREEDAEMAARRIQIRRTGSRVKNGRGKLRGSPACQLA